MADELTVADVLERAADLLWVRGRTKGKGVRDDGTMCVVGAIQAARGTGEQHVFSLSSEARAVVRPLEAYLAAHPEVIRSDYVSHEGFAEKIAGGRFPAWVWNDTTKDDDLVIDTLRRCAKELRAVES